MVYSQIRTKTGAEVSRDNEVTVQPYASCSLTLVLYGRINELLSTHARTSRHLRLCITEQQFVSANK